MSSTSNCIRDLFSPRTFWRLRLCRSVFIGLIASRSSHWSHSIPLCSRWKQTGKIYNLTRWLKVNLTLIVAYCDKYNLNLWNICSNVWFFLIFLSRTSCFSFHLLSRVKWRLIAFFRTKYIFNFETVPSTLICLSELF